MEFVRPGAYAPIDPDEFPHVPAEVVVWACSKSHIDDPEAFDQSLVNDVRRALQDLDMQMASAGGSSLAAEQYLLLSYSELFGSGPQTNVTELLSTQFGKDALTRSFLDGTLEQRVSDPHSNDAVVSTVSIIPTRVRLRVYETHSYSDQLVRAIEEIPDPIAWPTRFALAREIAPEVAHACVARHAFSVDPSAGPARTLFSVDTYLHFAPELLDEGLRRTPVSELLSLLSFARYTARETARDRLLPDQILESPDPLLEYVTCNLDNAILDALLSNTIITRLQNREQVDVRDLAQWLWDEAGRAAVLFDTSSDAEPRLLDATSDFLEAAPSLEELARWATERLKSGLPLRLSAGMATFVMRRLIDTLASDIRPDLLPILALPILEPGFSWWQDGDNQSLLEPFVAWAIQRDGRLESLMELGVESWGDPIDQSAWKDIVVAEWLEMERDHAGIVDGVEDVELFVVLYLTSAEFRERLNFFSFMRVNPNKLHLSPRVADLISAVVTRDQGRLIEVNEWITILKQAIELDNPTPHAVFEAFQARNEAATIPTEIWTRLGVVHQRVVSASLIETIRELWPDVGLAIARWDARRLMGRDRESHLETLKEVLPAADDFPQDVQDAIRIALIASLPHDPESEPAWLASLRDHFSPIALEKARELRHLVHRSDDDARAWCSVTWSLATVAQYDADDWKVLKALLLAFRALPEPAYDVSLKPNRSSDDCSGQIARTIDRILRNSAVQKDLRRNWALDIVNRLKPYSGDPSARSLAPTVGDDLFSPEMNEPSAIWRRAYVLALADLGVNQTGKGHATATILRKVVEHDPSPAVQKEAAQVLEKFSHMNRGWESGSHRRLLFHAWWWFRQAGRLALGYPVDEKEANRIRNTEFR